MKKQNIYKGFFPYHQSLFDKCYACWASNHRGWCKMKKRNKKAAKKNEKTFILKDNRDY